MDHLSGEVLMFLVLDLGEYAHAVFDLSSKLFRFFHLIIWKKPSPSHSKHCPTWFTKLSTAIYQAKRRFTFPSHPENTFIQ